MTKGAPSTPAVPLDPDGKGLGPFPPACTTAGAAGLGWNLLAEDVSLPVAVLYESRVRHNLAWMQRFMEAYRVKLAPHGKTTMSPTLFQRQIDAGAWGITLATAPQTQAAYRHGIRRVIMANQLVGKANMAIIAQLLRDPSFTYFCIVDSATNAAQLGRYFGDQGLTLPVLIELGPPGGRTGVREPAQLREVAAEIARWPALALAGVEVYEGVLQEEPDIRAFLRRAADALRELAAAGRLRRNGPALISGAGSAWFDVVAEEFSQIDIGAPLDVVLRPGCYLSHDVGIYRSAAERIQARNPVARGMAPGLLPALQVWAYVQSMPEPGRAIVALGKRDAAFDAGLPEPARHYRPGAPAGARPLPAPPQWKLTAMMDQHAFMQVGPGDDIAVGDMIAFDISHPCLTFDKWRQVLLVDDDYRVTGVAPTYF
ncbi:amino acid deaminase [Achromobacter sp. Marseille-Q4962]|uniref:amino acid deaminase n=1 Tax=Achromobacter sp. Marseille-Q4962 TaxID=2942202 RepID=UPI0020746702|nr:amino acid deaminase [Achromobacter sp. Marseille-Q4962]